jgi:hypothetical protein
VPRVLFDRSGNVVDTLEMVRTLVSRPAKVVEFENRRSFVYLEPPARDSGTYQVDLEPGSFLVHWSVEGDPARGSLVAVRVGEGGDTTRTARLEYGARAVTDHYRDSLAASRVRGRLSTSDSLRLFEAYRSAQQLPPHHRPIWPPFVVGEAAREGTLWTKLDPDDPGANRWLVFRQDGEPWGTLSLPMGDFPRWSGRDQLWIMERDDFDVPWLVRYRVTTPAG